MVTGAGGGLGRALVSRLEARGHEVVGVDVAGTDRRLDVTDAAACRALAEEVRPAVWINGAGVLGAGSAATQPDEEVRRLVEVNLMGVINGTRAALAVMRESGGGHILNVGSLASWTPVPGETIYAATKHAVRAFTVGIAVEEAASGVEFSVLCPDGIWTPMLHDRLQDPAAAMSFTGARLLTAGEVADAAIELLDEPRILVSVPAWRGAQTRLIGIAPSLSVRLGPLFAKVGRRNQAKLARTPPPKDAE